MKHFIVGTAKHKRRGPCVQPWQQSLVFLTLDLLKDWVLGNHPISTLGQTYCLLTVANVTAHCNPICEYNIQSKKN